MCKFEFPVVDNEDKSLHNSISTLPIVPTLFPKLIKLFDVIFIDDFDEKFIEDFESIFTLLSDDNSMLFLHDKISLCKVLHWIINFRKGNI